MSTECVSVLGRKGRSWSRSNNARTKSDEDRTNFRASCRNTDLMGRETRPVHVRPEIVGVAQNQRRFCSSVGTLPHHPRYVQTNARVPQGAASRIVWNEPRIRRFLRHSEVRQDWVSTSCHNASSHCNHWFFISSRLLNDNKPDVAFYRTRPDLKRPNLPQWRSQGGWRPSPPPKQREQGKENREKAEKEKRREKDIQRGRESEWGRGYMQY